MSQQRVARMIADHQAAIARQEDPITHATICDVLRDLAADAITEGQALRMLTITVARIDDAARQALYRQVIAELRQMQAERGLAGKLPHQCPLDGCVVVPSAIFLLAATILATSTVNVVYCTVPIGCYPAAIRRQSAYGLCRLV